MYREKDPNEETRKKKGEKERESRRSRFERCHFFFLFFFLGRGKSRKGRSEGDSRVRSNPRTVVADAVKGRRDCKAGTRERAQMMEGGDECILSREKRVYVTSATAGVKGRGYVLASLRHPTLPSKVVVNAPLQSIKRYRVNEGGEGRRRVEVEKELYYGPRIRNKDMYVHI